jgi:predicted nucleic acid-binding Zn ribbon protein
MSLKSIGNVLGSVGNQYKRQHHVQIQHVQECWTEVVGTVVAAQTYPVSVYRGVLKVATASSAWAQNLTFERQRILEKLNVRVAPPLTDIRFSTANWQNSPPQTGTSGLEEQDQIWQNHPSLLPNAAKLLRTTFPEQPDPKVAFRHWSKLMQTRSRHLPICPACSCPTPPGELERWSLCSFCAAKQWGGDRL